MNAIIKSTIAICGLLAAVSTPLIAEADTFILSGSEAYGDLSGSKGNLSLYVTAFENTSKSKSTKSGSPGAYASGNYYDASTGECWFAYGYTDNIQFKAMGSLAKKVTASGAVPVTWHEYCSGSYSVVTDTVLFNEDLSAIGIQANTSWGTKHIDYGYLKQNIHFDSRIATATVDASSSLSSEHFGEVIIFQGNVGESKSHDVQIIKIK